MFNTKEVYGEDHRQVYYKGTTMLYNLKYVLGDSLFNKGMKHYVNQWKIAHPYLKDMRTSFINATHTDLNWFFDQWYLDQGHPIMDVTYDYADGKMMIYTSQIQDVENHRPIFILPLEAAVYDTNGKVSYHSVVIDARKDTIIINGINERPLVTVLDGKSTLLGEVREDRDSTEIFALLQYSPNHFDKRIAANMLNGNPAIANIAGQLIEDKHHILRNLGVTTAGMSEMDKIKSLITEDPHSSVRANALMKYGSEMGEKAAFLAELVLKNEQAYGPLKPALAIVYQYDPAKGIQYAENMMSDESPAIVGQLADFFAQTGDAKYLNYIEDNMSKIDIYQLFNVFGKYSDLLLNQDTETILSRVDMLKNMGIEDDNMYRRYLATNTLNSIKNKFIDAGEAITEIGAKKENEKRVVILQSVLDEIINKEKDESLVARYGAY
jgi:aminopeptidase N